MSGAALPMPVGLRDRVLAWRDRVVGSARFRAFATRFPLTRPVARARAAALFELCAGFVYSQVFVACVRLELFDRLRDGPLSVAALAPALRLTEDATLRLLEAAASLRLVERRGARFGLGPLGAAMLDDAGVAAMVTHHAALYDDLRDPVALLRGEAGATALGRYWPYAGAARPDSLPGEAVAEYSALMAASQPMVSAEVLSAYRFGRHRALLDLGGGEGAFAQAVAESAPGLRVTVFDLPAVAARARARFAAAGLSARADAVGGDLFGDAPPAGADIVTLVRVLHDHDDDAAMAILRAARSALRPGGTLLIAEPMAGTAGAEAMGAAYFGFYLLAMGSGRPRSAEALTAMVRAAGFASPKVARARMPLVARVLTARAD